MKKPFDFGEVEQFLEYLKASRKEDVVTGETVG